jgi:hypothetical protein
VVPIGTVAFPDIPNGSCLSVLFVHWLS